MIQTPIYRGILQSDLNLNGFSAGGGGSGSGTGLPPGWVSVKSAPYNAAGDGVTDDTSALQAAINNMVAIGGGTIYFPPGKYLIGGPLQDTSGRNAQIVLPSVPDHSSPVTIELLGALPPPTQLFYDQVIQPTAYSILKSTLTGGTGTAAFMAGIEASGGLWDNVMLVVRNIVFEAPPNPSFTVFNCFDTMAPHFEHVLIYTGSFNYATIVEPMHTNAVGIKLAPSNHSGGQTVNFVTVLGFYTGMQDGELANVRHFVAWGCKQGLLVPFTYHPSIYTYLGWWWCPRGIVAAGPGSGGISGGDDGTHYIRVMLASVENQTAGGGFPAWMVRVYDVDDASNLLKGDLKWISIQGGVGNDHTFIKNGGTHLLTGEVGT